MPPPEHRLDIRRLPKAHKTPHVSRRFSYISSVVRKQASQGRREGPYITPTVTCHLQPATHTSGDVAKPNQRNKGWSSGMQACSAMSHFAGTALVVELLSSPYSEVHWLPWRLPRGR